MRKLLFILPFVFGTALAQTVDMNALKSIQDRNDNMRDAYMMQQERAQEKHQREIDSERRAYNNSLIQRNKEAARSIAQRNQFIKDNQNIDLEERRLKLHHDQVRANHDEDFVKGELDRQKAINNQINSGKVQLNVNSVDGD